ncbi:MAG: hypothetical protein KDA24_28870, partial [Deltaproteobacteria bacterium]|nr:hypothetical protein [Deltaproteobacteria bacterium]
FLRQGLAQGEDLAACALARVHLYGIAGEAVDLDKSVELLGRCIAQGSRWAPAMLGLLVEDGRVPVVEGRRCLVAGPGAEVDLSSSGADLHLDLRCYRLAATRGHRPAMQRLTSRFRLP